MVLRRDEYDIYTSESLQSELRALASGRATIDFRNVRYMDSTGIGCLIRAFKRVLIEDPGSTIALEGVSPRLRRLFLLVGLDRVFEIEDAETAKKL